MKQTDLTCAAFSAALASAAPSPGGGGAAALSGSLACALGRMASLLCAGKKHCAPHGREIEAIAARLEGLRANLLELVDADEAGFLPLTQAWAMDKSDPARESAVERALAAACEAPLRMMDALAECAGLLARLAPVCAPIVISDVGAGAALCAGAIRAAGLNVLVNAGLMKDRPAARGLANRAKERVAAARWAEDAFAFVESGLSGRAMA